MPFVANDLFSLLINQAGAAILAWGWLVILFFVLVIAWATYKLIKKIDFISSIQWTYLQITVPEDNPQTPKSMENVYDVLGGIHKNPDLIERFFEGYTNAWYSCELQCEPHRVRYVMVLPTAHRKFFEGVIYGQYHTAEIKEVEDYTLNFNYQDIEKEFDVYATEIIMTDDDIFPIRTYHEYEDAFAEDDKFVDPHQALIEAYTNLRAGEQFWVQFLVRPLDAKVIDKWAERGEEAIAKIAGTAKEKPAGIGEQLFTFFMTLPGEIWQAFSKGPVMAEAKKEKQQRLVYTPTDEAKMKGILQKTSRQGFRVKIRLVHISKAIPFHKQSASTAIGAFKQFNTFNLNSLKPDPDTKTNGPNYFLKLSRRKFRKKKMLLYYQWRDFWGEEDGHIMSAEELATLYHFPVKYLRAPAIERATSGLGSAPENIPFV